MRVEDSTGLRPGEFDEDASGRAWVQKRDPFSTCPRANARRDQRQAGQLRASGRIVDVGDGETDVMDPRAARLEEAGDRGIGRRRLEQFDASGAVAEEGDAYGFRRNFLFAGRVLTEQGSV